MVAGMETVDAEMVGWEMVEMVGRVGRHRTQTWR
jgi:hypothetical protein